MKRSKNKVIKMAIAELELVSKLSKDLKAQAGDLTRYQARYLVDTYYEIQDFRIRAAGQLRSATEEHPEPNMLLTWVTDQMSTLEKEIVKALQIYAESHEAGRWALSVCGIGPVIAAGLLAHIDVTRASTAGDVWRYAGLDPTLEWLGKDKSRVLVNEILGTSKKITDEQIAQIGARVNRTSLNIHELLKNYDLAVLKKKQTKENQGEDLDDDEEEEIKDLGKPTKDKLIKILSRQPWNAKLKVLCWKAGQSFQKQKGREECFYGHLIDERKMYELDRNERGQNKEAADKALQKNLGKSTIAYKYYSQGKLPPAHIDARARRHAVKLFIAHYFHVAYESHHQTPPPKPYVIQILGHKDYIAPPNWPMS